MKAILSICLILLYNNAFTTSQLYNRFLKHNPPPPNVTERRLGETSTGIFIQKLDHFDPDNKETFSQRFFVNTEFYNNESNVAFLMLGGEDAASEIWMTYGSWVDNAKKYGAVLFQLEHRYYGESHPFSDLATENLRFLTSEQALADAADFIESMNIQYFLGSKVKWVSFGGSYAGSLSAWLRLKYPDLVYGAVSSSGPLQAQADYSGYFQVVADDFKDADEECFANLKKAMAQVDDLLANPDSSDENITSIFNLCEPIEQYDVDDINVINFYNRLGDVFALVAQYHGQLGITFDLVCGTLNNETKGSEIHRLASLVKGVTCINYDFNTDIEEIRNTTIISEWDMVRQWYYQVCTEFGWFQTTNREDKVFGRGCSVDYYFKMCTDIFGPDFNSTFINNEIDKTNADYYGIDINATRIISIHGSLDPWHSAGLLKANNDDSPVIFIEGTSHCADMYELAEGDLPQLIEAREEVTKIIGEWLE